MDMEIVSTLAQAQNSLAPYIKPRKDVAHIRQVLAAHLESQLDHATGYSQSPVLSLIHDSTNVKSISGIVPGLQKEYLKAVRANIKAQREYSRVCNTDRWRCDDSTSLDGALGSTSYTTNTLDKSDQLDGYLALIKQRQRLQRLQILQDYANKLEQKSTAATACLDLSSAQSLELPKVPAEILGGSTTGTKQPNDKSLKDLIRSLEQAVLYARFQLRNERQLLEEIRVEKSKDRPTQSRAIPRDIQILQALGSTRNELIAWIEAELGKAGDSEPGADETLHQPPANTNESIEDQLTIVRAQYGRYIQARKKFINTIDEIVEPIVDTKPTGKDGNADNNETENIPAVTWIVSPYLRNLQLISNEQKSAIQQKSHLTVSLAKQHKETVQLFDRLAHESHLLQAYPLHSSSRNLHHFDLDEMAGKETPGAAHRARAWTHAEESASAASKDIVLANIEEGETNLQSAQEMLSNLDELFGRRRGQAELRLEDDIWTAETSSTSKAKNQGGIWAILDGNLGTLQEGSGGHAAYDIMSRE